MHQVLQSRALALASDDVQDGSVVVLHILQDMLPLIDPTVFFDWDTVTSCSRTLRWLYLNTYADDANSLQLIHFKFDALPSTIIFHRLHHTVISRSLARCLISFSSYGITMKVSIQF